MELLARARESCEASGRVFSPTDGLRALSRRLTVERLLKYFRARAVAKTNGLTMSEVRQS